MSARRAVTVHVDVTSTLQAESMTGIQRVTTEVLGRLIGTPLADELGIEVVPVAWTHWLRRWRRVPAWEFARGPGQPTTRHRLWWNRARKLVARRHRIGPGGVFFDIDAAWQNPLPRAVLLPELRRAGVRIVNVHYDLTPVLFPEYFAEDLLAVFEDFVRAEETYADRILCISKAVADELVRHAGRALPVSVIPLGVDHVRAQPAAGESQPAAGGSQPAAGGSQPAARGSCPPRRLVHVGTIEPRKDVGTILDAFELLAPDFDDLELVLIGREGWKATEVAGRIRSHPLCGGRLSWVERAGDAEVAAAFQEAFCVLVASRYEGYGLPVAEALARGCVVVSTDGGALAEVAPGLVDHVGVGDAPAIAAAVRRYLVDGDAWRTRRAEVAGWVAPSWDDTARIVGRALAGEEPER